jgi:predicted RNase H-like HicB family nuclease
VTTMSEPLALQLSVVYREIEDGWIMATIPEFPAAMSQGRTREEARENVRDALRELLLSYAREGAPAPIDAGSTGEPLELTISP